MIVRNSRNQKMVIDEEDLYLLKPNRKNPGLYYFTITNKGYVQVSINGKIIQFHHLIIGNPPEDLVTDHVNRVRNDNRRCNLRHVTHSQNNLNKAKRENCSSKYRGVSFKSKNSKNKFQSQIRFNLKFIYLGCFPTELEAAQAYDRYIIENNLPQQLNFPHETSLEMGR